MGRPKIQIDEEQLLKLAMLHCTNLEIAHFFDCSEDTITGRFSDILAKGRSEGKRRLRKAQIALALKGNATMLIWLGKQMLGQQDRMEGTGFGNTVVNVNQQKAFIFKDAIPYEDEEETDTAIHGSESADGSRIK